MNTLTLNPDDEGMEALANCKVGEEKTLCVTGKVTANESGNFTMEVASVEDYMASEEEGEEEAEVPEPPAKKGPPSAVAILIESKKGKPAAKA